MEQIKKENIPKYIMTNIHSVVWMLMDNLSFVVVFFYFIVFTAWLEPQQCKL